MTYEEEKDYISARSDLLKAISSFQKLKREHQQQLLLEIVGSKAYASVWQAIQSMSHVQR